MALIPKGETAVNFKSPLNTGAFSGFSAQAINSGFELGNPVFTSQYVEFPFAEAVPDDWGWWGYDLGKIVTINSLGLLDEATSERESLFDLRTDARDVFGSQNPRMVCCLDMAVNPNNNAIGVLFAWVPHDEATVYYGVCELTTTPDRGTILGARQIMTKIAGLTSRYYSISDGQITGTDFERAFNNLPLLRAEILTYRNDTYYIARKTNDVTIFSVIRDDPHGPPATFRVEHEGKKLAAYDSINEIEFQVHDDGGGRIVQLGTPPTPLKNFAPKTFRVDEDRYLFGQRGYSVATETATRLVPATHLGRARKASQACLFKTGLSTLPFVMYQQPQGTGGNIVLTTIIGFFIQGYTWPATLPGLLDADDDHVFYFSNIQATPFRTDVALNAIDQTGSTPIEQFHAVIRRESIDYTPGRIQRDGDGVLVAQTANARLMTVTVPTSILPDAFFLGDGDIASTVQPFFIDYRGTKYEVDSILSIDEEARTTIILRF